MLQEKRLSGTGEQRTSQLITVAFVRSVNICVGIVCYYNSYLNFVLSVVAILILLLSCSIHVMLYRLQRALSSCFSRHRLQFLPQYFHSIVTHKVDFQFSVIIKGCYPFLHKIRSAQLHFEGVSVFQKSTAPKERQFKCSFLTGTYLFPGIFDSTFC